MSIVNRSPYNPLMSNVYGEELRRRRDRRELTVRDLGRLIDRSPTFVTDFEINKKSNPPEPEMMSRLESVLGWAVADQLSAWGYQITPPTASEPDAPDIAELVSLIRRIALTPSRAKALRAILSDYAEHAPQALRSTDRSSTEEEK